MSHASSNILVDPQQLGVQLMQFIEMVHKFDIPHYCIFCILVYSGKRDMYRVGNIMLRWQKNTPTKRSIHFTVHFCFKLISDNIDTMSGEQNGS